jgi:dihydrodiol dehydrogenase / D-xylose 1-dehydrogenase (NADP)
MSLPPIGWAIIGPGRIAGRFAGSLNRSGDARLLAVASRDAGRAAAFAAANGASGAKVCSNAAEAAATPGVDAVYIASPHPMHHAAALTAIAAGRAVLCEKPMTLNASHSGELVAAARGRGTFLMEAMWTRCLPATKRIRAWLGEGRIGRPRLLTGGFGFACPPGRDRISDPALGGGSLLDVGVYPLAYAMMVFGAEPSAVTGCATLGTTGVDEQATISLAFPCGGLASLHCAVHLATDRTGRIHGERGTIAADQFWRATSARLEPVDAPAETFSEEPLTEGFDHQLAEVHRCLRAGLVESPSMPWSESLALARTTDALRRQWGLRYPGE